MARSILCLAFIAGSAASGGVENRRNVSSRGLVGEKRRTYGKHDVSAIDKILDQARGLKQKRSAGSKKSSKDKEEEIGDGGANDVEILDRPPTKSPHAHAAEHLPVLAYKGNGLPHESYAQCEGDCDTDEDCIGKLVCFQRAGLEPVPGCKQDTGYSYARMDYCIDSSDLPVTNSPSRRPSSNPTRQPIPPEDTSRMSSGLPECPPRYDIATAYSVGDAVDNEEHIFVCRHPPYTQYCSIVVPDDSWKEEEKTLWRDAWEYVGACERQTVSADAASSTETQVPSAHPTSNPTTAAPTTASPTQRPSIALTTAPVTDSPTRRPTPSPTRQPDPPEDTNSVSSGLPDCPPQYDIATTYSVGDAVDNEEQIFVCRHPPYTQYCSIVVPDVAWSEEEKTLWRDAWEYVGACERQAVTAGDATSEVPVTTTTTSPPCPRAYDPFRTDYVAFEQVTILCEVFQCRDEAHAYYCNTAAWDDSLFDQNDQAQQMWMDAWELVGSCSPTQSELMEEEAIVDEPEWGCLA